jgi:hypothetical protein
MTAFSNVRPGRILAVMVALSACANSQLHAQCTAVSGKQRVTTLELYTSEGCSSCPPADRWINSLRAKKLDTDRVIPLAFHVDYWNYIGWTDPYSQAQFSERQRQHSRRRGAKFVFTPQLLLNGDDYRMPMIIEDIGDKVNAINQTRPQANIHLKVERSNDRYESRLEIDVVREVSPNGIDAYLALYENNLVSRITAGENNGVTLKHDHVVRELVGPLTIDDDRHLHHTFSFALGAAWKTRDIHVAAFVQNRNSGDILQALDITCP